MALPVPTVALSIPVTVAPVAKTRLVLASSVVPEIAAGVAPPITVPSIVPPSTSTVLAASTLNGKVIKEGIFLNSKIYLTYVYNFC